MTGEERGGGKGGEEGREVQSRGRGEERSWWERARIGGERRGDEGRGDRKEEKRSGAEDEQKRGMRRRSRD